MHRKAFTTIVLRNIAGLTVSSYKKFESRSLEFLAGCDSVRDGAYWQDQELHQTACMREKEIERLWAERDLAEVQSLNCIQNTSFQTRYHS
jgi:hypothetical protein